MLYFYLNSNNKLNRKTNYIPHRSHISLLSVLGQPFLPRQQATVLINKRIIQKKTRQKIPIITHSLQPQIMLVGLATAWITNKVSAWVLAACRKSLVYFLSFSPSSNLFDFPALQTPRTTRVEMMPMTAKMTAGATMMKPLYSILTAAMKSKSLLRHPQTLTMIPVCPLRYLLPR